MQLKHKPLSAEMFGVLITLTPLLVGSVIIVLVALTPLETYAAETNPARESTIGENAMSTPSMPTNFDYFIEGIRNVHP